jgi:uncharacterized membrane protein
MNKEQFLYKLEELLQSFSPEERRDILYDYEEHFRIGIEEGKSEEGIAKELGDPRYIVAQYNKSEGNSTNNFQGSTFFGSDLYRDFRQTSALRSVLTAIFLFFLNITLIGPFIAAYATVFSFFVASFAIFLSSIFLLLSPIVPALVYIPFHVPFLALILFAIGLASLGALFFIGSYYAGKYVYKITINYLRFNIRLIKGYRRGEDYV